MRLQRSVSPVRSRRISSTSRRSRRVARSYRNRIRGRITRPSLTPSPIRFPGFRPSSSSSRKSSSSKRSPEIEFVQLLEGGQVFPVQGSPQSRPSTRRGAYPQPRIFSEGHLRNLYAIQADALSILNFYTKNNYELIDTPYLLDATARLRPALAMRDFFTPEQYAAIANLRKAMIQLIQTRYAYRALEEFANNVSIYKRFQTDTLRNRYSILESVLKHQENFTAKEINDFISLRDIIKAILEQRGVVFE